MSQLHAFEPKAPSLNGATLETLDTPCLLLDGMRISTNIARMRARLERLGVGFRPHLKTAKSIDVARLAMTSRSGPITVSTLREAEYFADHGVTDMVYGVGIAPAKLDRVSTIRARNVELAVVLDSVEQAEAVAAHCRRQGEVIPALIEVDADGHRSGVAPTDPGLLLAIARRLTNGPGLRGVLIHAGASYDLNRPDALMMAADGERDVALAAAGTLVEAGFPCPVISVGSTPTARFARHLNGITEVRAGVFMFGDLCQVGIGSMEVGDLALSVLATVIGRNRSQGRIVIDAGWMALSRDRSTARQVVDQGYGMVCDLDCEPYADLIVSDVNQEHGIVAVRAGSSASMPDLAIGSRVRILPNHACATAAQHDRYHMLDHNEVTAVWPRVSGW